jgi:hypothetical protein
MFPDGYSDYARHCRQLDKAPNKLLARFATRYKMAGQLESISLLDHTSVANEVYLRAMRITLAHTSLECLQSFMGEKLPIKNLPVAKKLREMKSDKTREYFIGEADPNMRRDLKRFYGSKNDSNLNAICSIIRHTMSHGQFSPSPSGLNNKSGLLILREIEESIFKSMAEAARLVFEKEMAKLNV